MRKALCAVAVIATSALLALASAASADSPWSPVTDPLGSGTANGSLTRPAGVSCTFNLGISVVANRQQQRTIALGPPAPAGTTQTDFRGELVLSFTNLDTGATVTRDVSGPYDEVDYPDGSGGQTGAGNQWWQLGPLSRANTKLPGEFISTGPVVMQFNSQHVITSLQANKVTNLCQLLGGSSA
jgi:hypothetical protein